MAMDDIYSRAARRSHEEDLDAYVAHIITQREEASSIFRCLGCGREESICSADPCEGVIADRLA